MLCLEVQGPALRRPLAFPSIVTRGENDDKAARNCGKIAAYAAAPSFEFLPTADAARQVFRLTGMSAV
ncbi:hypothetical protein RGR602_CH03846 [Rhizobium gallicum bv. gallicum R602sp]|uniref:Uncharacterized protein n=1 Tax=Rhizobium gallicum bv. gallicum R602sp TaxID=1041138 RepID=A0A0B4X8U0_9HYPH|nr:hypothetical protein RGR602_CH03846 [Rhizobium gallicum bv. gallicum R602sp]